MKRDLDLVRSILLACEAHQHGYAPHPLVVEGYDEEEIGFHVHLMIEAGLINGHDMTHMGSLSPTAMAGSLTWQGYEFLEASREEPRWEKTKAAAKSVGALTFEAVKSTLAELAAAAVKKAVGLP